MGQSHQGIFKSKEEVIFLPRTTKRKYPSHGDKVMEGRLIGQTDTDYFYFLCPRCEQMMQAEPLKFIRIEKEDYVLHIGLFCIACRLHELVKIGSTGWKGGDIKNRRAMLDYLCQRVPCEQPTADSDVQKVKKTKPRQLIRPRQRFNIMLQYGFRCVYCGRTPSQDGIRLVIDHLEPRAAGGPDEDDNYAPCCEECNQGKGKTEILPKE
jgi:hypothetical protein